MLKKALIGGFACCLIGIGAIADTPKYIFVPGAIKLSTAKMTKFDPTKHGFAFVNSFQTVTGVFDIVVGGLCGGMVYAALDYYNAKVPTPSQNYTPASGSALHGFIWDRHDDSLTPHLDKWSELHLNPFGARNSEFFNWGLQGFGGGRLQELRAKIDAGIPVPLGLKSMDADPSNDHVVLAVGYDLGRYKGDLGQFKEDFKIFLYDPNAGRRIVTLVPKVAEQKFCLSDYNYRNRSETCWRTYFVQQNYHKKTPPVIPVAQNELIVGFGTGGDDLRGGGDNVNLKIHFKGGAVMNAANVNKSQRWINGSFNEISVKLPIGTNAGDISKVTVNTQFRGGFDGDNWNLDELTFKVMEAGSQTFYCAKAGQPIVRFTGDVHNFDIAFPC